MMVSTHIGHDCIVEDNTVMSNLVQIGGHCKIETGVWFSGLAASHQFVTIGKWCYVAGLAGINRDIPPFLTVSGHYPPRVRGVNKRGLNRAGLSDYSRHITNCTGRTAHCSKTHKHYQRRMGLMIMSGP